MEPLEILYNSSKYLNFPDASAAFYKDSRFSQSFFSSVRAHILLISHPQDSGLGTQQGQALLVMILKSCSLHEDIFSEDSFTSGLSTPSSSSTFQLVITHGSVSFSIYIPNSLHPLAIRLHDSFISRISRSSGDEAWDEEIGSGSELLVRFMDFIGGQIELDRPNNQDVPAVKLLSRCLDAFEQDSLGGNNVHPVVAGWSISPAKKASCIRVYFHTRNILRRSDQLPRSSLLRVTGEDKAKVYAIFGGQGSNENYFDELRDVYTTYRPILQDLVFSAAQLLQQNSQDPGFSAHYIHGLNILGWLEDTQSQPDTSYLISAPVSFPIIGLLQLCHVAVFCHGLGCDPSVFQKLFAGATGHSQGVVIAAIIAASTCWLSFEKLSLHALDILQSIGCRSQQVFPVSSLDPSIIADAEENGEGCPTPMLSIKDLPLEKIQDAMRSVNRHLPIQSRVEISLLNSRQNIVVSGPPMSLHGLNVYLRTFKAPASLNQTRIPFNERKPTFSTRFLPITAPFHSSYLAEAIALVEDDLRGKGVVITGKDLLFPVYATHDGSDIGLKGPLSIVSELVEMIVLKPVLWNETTIFPNATHIIDFGPGGTAGVGVLTNKNKEGGGVRTILATLLDGANSDVGYKSEIFDRDAKHHRRGTWEEKYAPTLTRTSSGRTLIDSKMSRLLGLPPVMVGGMTPTTVSVDFVIATMNEGYHIELAAGGYHSKGELSAAIQEVAARASPGRGIAINVIYANPHVIRWQIPLITQLRAEGLPIEGLTIGAGVPSVDIANQYIQDIGLRYIGFKPSSNASIQQVIDIARANPSFPVLMQWTGGRAGGHHSFEDLHRPILEMYGRIRNCDNIVLLAGSGLGDAEDSYPYVSGRWSQKFGYPVMPFDGVLLGSRVMVAKEARTSPEAKQAIVDANGVDDNQWQQTYKGPAGGVITVISEMGEPIHKLATRGVQFWAEMDKTIFSIKDKTKRVEQLQKKRDYIIKRLNSDFAKVWFGKNSAGNPVDIEEMTYAEVISRTVDLSYVKHQQRWIHVSFQKLVYDFILRAEAIIAAGNEVPSITLGDLNNPYDAIQSLFRNAPQFSNQLLSYQDVQYFISLCRRRGQKPLPFITNLDEQFETWFKKDSLWQSEDLQAVPGQDVGRVCILQGPVAVKYSKIVDEPVKEILDEIYHGHIERILAQYHGGNITAVPKVECFGLAVYEPLGPIYFYEQDNKMVYQIPSTPKCELPRLDQWLGSIGGDHSDWRRAFFTSKVITQGRKTCENPVQRLFKPAYHNFVQVEDSDVPSGAVISLWETRDVGEPVKVVEVSMLNNIITLEILDDRNILRQPVGLKLIYRYQPEASWAPIQEKMEGRNDRIKDFYHRVWFGNALPMDLPASDESFACKFVAANEDITKFARCIGNLDSSFSNRSDGLLSAPLDFSIVVAWKALMMPLFATGLDVDLLKLVHLSNGFKMRPGAGPISDGDVLETKTRTSAIINQDSGKMIKVDGHILRDGLPIVDLTSSFLCRGTYVDHEHTFEKTDEVPFEVCLKSAKDVAVLKSKSWFQLLSPEDELLQMKLLFHLQTNVEYESKGVFSRARVSGQVTLQSSSLETTRVAIVDYTAGTSHGNPVMDFLRRYGHPAEGRVMFKNPVNLCGNGAHLFQTPASNESYASVSGDYNPIHVSNALSDYVQLPGTITHGMHTSAMVRSIVERWVCASEIGLFRGFNCSFTGMVLPSEEIEVGFQHVGMFAGRKIVRVEAKQKDTKTTVLIGEAEIEPPSTAYVFTGQGSQQKGMGMDLYAESAAARKVWDFADRHFAENYGFEITDIVRNNPQELTIHFGGIRGRRIRDNYMALTYETRAKDGTVRQERIFGDINEDTDLYTYRSATGLLSATQFTQPALTLMERAIFEDMRARGLVGEGSSYAGHSLGEYSALTSMTDVLPIESLVSLVFYRGMTIQVAVERDEMGRSKFSMCAVDPGRVSKTFDEAALLVLLRAISAESGWLLELVNYNIANCQYVCAGELRAIEALTSVCNTVKSKNINIHKLMHAAPGTLSSVVIRDLVRPAVAGSAALAVPITLTRGCATIPLSGIDVPFHSSFLQAGVGSFRRCLHQYISKENVDIQQLEGKYIPNLTAKPFEISRAYFEEVYKVTGSEVLKKVLEEWYEYEDPVSGFAKVQGVVHDVPVN